MISRNMIKTLSIHFLLLTLLLACRSGRAALGDGDGLSIKNAVVIKAKNEIEGTAGETIWLLQNCAGYTLLSKRSIFENPNSFDVFTIKMPDGKTKIIYFNTTRYNK